jgi:hypothetical protein
LRLMTRSNLVGCSTGRSAGLAPLRILSTTVYRWQSMLGREVHNPLLVQHVRIALLYDYRLRPFADCCGKGPLIVVGLSRL